MKTTKLTYTNRLLYDYKNIENILEKMALKGWKCTKFSNICIHYEKIEPQALKYNIICIPSLSQFDGSPIEKQENLISMCEEAGWKYVCQWAKSMIFCSEEENPTPIVMSITITIYGSLFSINTFNKGEVFPLEISDIQNFWI